jgi:hypothetical protein
VPFPTANTASANDAAWVLIDNNEVAIVSAVHKLVRNERAILKLARSIAEFSKNGNDRLPRTANERRSQCVVETSAAKLMARVRRVLHVRLSLELNEMALLEFARLSKLSSDIRKSNLWSAMRRVIERLSQR